MNNTTCVQCEHFHLHYILNKDRCVPIDCGHCSWPQVKKRRPTAAVCHRFTPRTMPPEMPDRDAVLKFLTVDMLEYILSLKLPPQVEMESWNE